MSTRPISVVFVCLGNICRSPLAEGAFRAHVDARGLADRFSIDSAGTSGYHVGEPPDPRSVQVANQHAVNIRAQRSRKFVRSDLDQFDYVIAMDRSNLNNIRSLGSEGQNAQTSLLLSERPGQVREVPDPYYGGPGGFDEVWEP